MARRPAAPDHTPLQNEIRRAINFFPPGEKNRREGVMPEQLKRAITLGVFDASGLSVRKVNAPASGEDEYTVSLNGELLFRVVWVPWPLGTISGRWHVRRHPAATWWR